MNKKTIIIIITALIIILGITGFIIWNNNNQIGSTISLDINSGIEINLTKSEKVKSVTALTSNANEIINDDLKGKSLNDTLKIIIDNVIEKDYIKDEVAILVNTAGNIDREKVKNIIEKTFEKKQIDALVIEVENITDDDKDFASEHDISPAKAAYINLITSENDEINQNILIDKPISELKETKETGRYCDEGYTLEGEFCVKEIGREVAINDSICPNGYEEVNGVCYEASSTIDEEYCKNNLKLENGKCVGTEKVDAKAKCSTGTYNSKTNKCEVLAYINAGTKVCRESDDLLLDNGKCAVHHMGAHFDEPDAVIDPNTECCCGDTYKNGWCYNLPNGDYDSTIKCSTGTYYDSGEKGAGCYKLESSDPTYYCDNGTLDSNKCVISVSKNPDKRPTCKDGLTLLENRICIDKNSTKEKEAGYRCEKENSRLENDTCIILEIVEANN